MLTQPLTLIMIIFVFFEGVSEHLREPWAEKYAIAIVIAFGALFGLSVQAAPLTENTAAIQSQVAKSSARINCSGLIRRCLSHITEKSMR